MLTTPEEAPPQRFSKSILHFWQDFGAIGAAERRKNRKVAADECKKAQKVAVRDDNFIGKWLIFAAIFAGALQAKNRARLQDGRG